MDRYVLNMDEPGIEEVFSKDFKLAVTVNGESIEAFELDGNTLMFLEELPVAATVVVKLYVPNET